MGKEIEEATSTVTKSKKRPVSIRDVAKASGVSLTTVSLVLNNGDRRISQPTRERVLAAIDKLGYRPNRLAQGLQNRRSNILAILVPQLGHTFADAYFGELISGIYDFANRSGYKILLEAASSAFIRQQKHLELFDRCFIDGLLFMGATDRHTFVRELRDRKYPFVLVNNVLPNCDYVVSDYTAAGGLAAEHLIELGHRDIAMIYGGTEVETARELRTSFVEALADRGVSLPAAAIEDGLYTEEGGAAATRRLLQRLPNVTAIFAGNDKMASGAIQCLQESGIRVPHDVSVVGCDDIHQSAFANPPLTTIHMPLYSMGRRACERLIQILEGKSESCQEVLTVELKVRQSTAYAPAPKITTGS
jgi:LacI family transcriptional regulator